MQTWVSFEKVALWFQVAGQSSALETSQSHPGAGCWLTIKAEKQRSGCVGIGVPGDDLKE